MDSNIFYSFGKKALQQDAVTDFFLHVEKNTFQQPPGNVFALVGTGQNAGKPDSPNPYLDTMNGPSAGLNDYQLFDQTGTTANYFGSINNGDISFGSLYSFAQTTLPQDPVLNMSAPNTTANQNIFTSLDIDASLQLSELGHIFEKPHCIFNSTSISYPAQVNTSEMYPDPRHHTFWSNKPTGEPLFSCDWPGCTSTKLFLNRVARSQHVSATHILDVLQNTSGSCTWPGCIKSKLDTSKKLETHVVNIHIEPLRCAINGCTRTEPFGRKGDLDRHIASVHKKERRWKCPRRNCTFYIKGFARKDKLNEHLRTKGHGPLKCEYRHCGGSAPSFAPFLTEAELLSHCDDDHGNFECGIGSCVNTSSAFTPRTLRYHVFRYHCSPRMDYEDISAIVYQIAERSQSNTRTITKGDFDGLEISSTCEECIDKFQPNIE